jgi:hypothetical protein
MYEHPAATCRMNRVVFVLTCALQQVERIVVSHRPLQIAVRLRVLRQLFNESRARLPDKPSTLRPKLKSWMYIYIVCSATCLDARAGCLAGAYPHVLDPLLGPEHAGARGLLPSSYSGATNQYILLQAVVVQARTHSGIAVMIYVVTTIDLSSCMLSRHGGLVCNSV